MRIHVKPRVGLYGLAILKLALLKVEQKREREERKKVGDQAQAEQQQTL